MIPTCHRCFARSETVLCSTCYKNLRSLLLGVRELTDELTVTIAGQGTRARSAAPVRAGATFPPLPYDPAASDALAEVLRVLRQWAIYFGKQLTLPSLQVADMDSPRHLATSLLAHLVQISCADGAEHFAADLVTASSDGWLAVDLPPVVEDIRPSAWERLLAVERANPDAMVTAAEALMMWPSLTHQRIAMWVKRGRIVRDGHRRMKVLDIAALVNRGAAEYNDERGQA